MELKMIAAVGKNNELGKELSLLKNIFQVPLKINFLFRAALPERLLQIL